MTLLYAIPAFILVLVWTPLFEEVIWRNPTMREVGPFLILDGEYGWGFWLLIFYAYALLLYGSALLMRTALRSAKQHRLQIVVLLVAVLAPWLGNVVYLFDMTPLPGVDYSPFAFTISGVAMTWAMLSHNLIGLIPIARSTMVENMQSGVVVLDKFQQVEYINAPASAILNWEGKRVKGSGLYGLCPSFSRFQEALEGNDYPPISEVVKCERDGETLWLDLYISALPDRSGALIGHLLMFQDITLRHQEREELRMLRQAVETSGEAIYMTDPEGIFTYVNPQFTALYGYTPEEVVGVSTPRILKSGEHSAREYNRFWDTLFKKEVVPINFINQTKDGRRIHVEGSTNPILDEEGDIQGFLAIQRDVTEEQRAKANLQDRVRELSFLNQLAEASVKTMDEDALIQKATRLVGEIFEPDYFGIMLVDEEDQELYLHSSYQLRGGKKDIRVPLGEGITGHVAQTGEQWYVADVRQEPAYISPGLGTRSELCVPLIVGRNVIGVINMESLQVDAFCNADSKLLKTFADQLAVAIERTRLFEKVQTLAITDDLTGLHNRRHFFKLARTEFERANRYQHPLSVIMVDVDDFKAINDRFGHAVGDQALRKIAAASISWGVMGAKNFRWYYRRPRWLPLWMWRSGCGAASVRSPWKRMPANWT